jgi:hypothetical protein
VAISIVGGATGTTSATLPTHQADDIIIGFAFRDGSTVQPTLPAGWNQLRDQAGTTCCSRTAWRRATGAGTTTGTWTNASRVAFIVLRGAWREFPIGSDAAGAGTAASVTYPALTVRKTDSTSMAVRFAGHRSIDTNLQTAPTNYTNLAAASAVDTIAENACHTRASIAANPTGDAVAVAGTASGWTAHTIEVLQDPGSGTVENYITEASNAGNTVSGPLPTGWFANGTLSITGVGTEGGFQYTEYRWQYTNGTGATDFPVVYFSEGTIGAATSGAGIVWIMPSDNVTFRLGFKTISGTLPTTLNLYCTTYTTTGTYVGETFTTSLSTIDSTIKWFEGSGTALANSQVASPSASSTQAAASSFDWTFRLYQPQVEFKSGPGSTQFVPTTVGPDYATASTGPSGTLATTDRPDAAAVSGTVENVATLASTDRPDAAAITALNAAFGTLDTTDRPDASAVSGTVANQAALATTDLPDAAAGAGTVANQAALASTDRPDAAAGAGSVENVGSLATTDRPDSASIAVFHAAFGALDTTDRPDSVGIAGLAENQAALATTDRPDSTAGAGTVENRAALATTDRPDAAAGAGSVENVGSLATTDRPDSSAVAALVQNQASLATTDRPDSAAIDGTVLSGISAVLATTDLPDSAAFAGSLNVFGALAVTDRPDSVAVTGQVQDVVSGALAATEAPDSVFITSSLLDQILIVFDVVEAADGAAILAWTYPWRNAPDPQTNPWLPGSALTGAWTEAQGPLSSFWSPNAGSDGSEVWAEKPDPTSVWE